MYVHNVCHHSRSSGGLLVPRSMPLGCKVQASNPSLVSGPGLLVVFCLFEVRRNLFVSSF